MQYVNSLAELREFFDKQKEVVLYGSGYVGRLVILYSEVEAFKDRIKMIYQSVPPVIDEIEGIRVIKNPAIPMDSCLGQPAILVSTKENLHEEIKDIVGVDIDQLFFTADDLVKDLELLMRSKEYGERTEHSRSTVSLIETWRSMNEKTLPMSQLSFSVHLCEHCNLNCVGCNNFAPLAEEEYTDIEEFERDFERLAFLSDGDAYYIKLTGGEPLLNHRASEYAAIARKYFPKAIIGFITNGTLIKKQSEEFFECLRMNKIDINITPYPINLDYSELKEWTESKGIRVRFFPDDQKEFKWAKEIFDINPVLPKSPDKENWTYCYKPGNCIQLKQGKLGCTTICSAEHFMNAFHDTVPAMYYSKRDFIDIYEVTSIHEIFDFFSNPFPFCKYCRTKERPEVVWRASKKEITEWT